MFQPNPKPLIPKLIKARVPVWLLVGALAVQYAVNNVAEQKTLIAESTYKEFISQLIHLNIKS